jgi:hypothetical protein
MYARNLALMTDNNGKPKDDMRRSSVPVIACVLFLGCNDDSVNQVPFEGEGKITAAYKMAAVSTLANSYGKGLRLISVSSEGVGPDGTSPIWRYEYVETPPPTPPPPATYCFHSTYSMVAFDSNSTSKVGSAIITHTWFDSNVALTIAEDIGGRQFRAQNPNSTITAGLGEPVVPYPTTYWWITYHAKEDKSKSLTLGIDANTGLITTRYP